MYVILKESGVYFDYRNIDTVKGENLSEFFTKLNPSNQVPVLTRTVDGEVEKVIGGQNSLFLFTVNAYPDVKKKFYSEL